ncbi:MAG: YtxH domain-containing protein [Anaerolineae bacterium]|nr:YtxH domain-containing protein [Anaerolineae bacterium]
MEQKGNFGAFLTGFFMGGLIGAAVALLLAPQSGKETREQIVQKGTELSDQAAKAAEEARAKAEKALADARGKLDEATKELQAKAKELQDQGRVLLEERMKSKEAEAEPPAEGITLEETAAEA